MGRDDFVVFDVVGQLDFAGEGAVVDFHEVHAYAAAVEVGFVGFGIGRHVVGRL